VSAPYVVVDGDASAGRARARLEDAGWRMFDGFDSRPALARAALVGDVMTARDAAAALLAALDGFGLLIRAAPEDAAILDRLVDDLRRIGPVEHETGPGGDTAARGPVLHPEGRAILGLLAEGHSLGEAAHLLGLSRRTADRRLVDARSALGVTRTTEAIARASRHGWLRPG
jgi:DNA-binding NarL/FixJ family response regulator